MKKSFGDRLRHLRGMRPQTEIAPLFGVKQSAYSYWERGEKEPNIETIAAICNHYKCSSDWLLGLSDLQNGHAPAVAEAPVPYGHAPPAPPVCAACAAKDRTIAQLSESVAQLAAAINRPAAAAEKKSPRNALCAAAG